MAGRFDVDVGALIRRLVAGGTDEQTAAIIARAAETGMPQTLPGNGLVRPPVHDPDTARYLDTLSIRERAGLTEPHAPRRPDFSLGSDDWMAMSRSADANAPGRLRQRSNPIPGGRRGDPNPAGDLKRIAAQNIDDARAAREAASRPSPAGRVAKGAAAAGAAAGVGVMLAPKDMGLTEAGNPADLKDEPAVPDFIDSTMMGMDESDMLKPVGQKPADEPVDYSLEARKIIDRLNAMRRKAGGEVPEAKQMMQEAERLIAMGNKQRNDPAYKIPKADPARDPYEQARNLIAQVNRMYQQGFKENDPRVQQVMAKVRELQAQGDAIRNRGNR